jgi:hypothetical protein
MIEPHVLHGGASSWFRMAANSDRFAAAGGVAKVAGAEA